MGQVLTLPICTNFSRSLFSAYCAAFLTREPFEFGSLVDVTQATAPGSLLGD